jgi:hypothetical protein
MKLSILKDNVWETITELAKTSKHADVAVAYLGVGATKLLPLKKGDTLVIDMSQGAVIGGQTNPFEVERYVKKEVNVFTFSNLHAKVFAFDETLVVGSANVSKNSEDYLTEVCLLCTDNHILAQARKMIKSLQVEPVTPEYINICKKIYRPPRFRKKPSSGQSNLWLVGVWPLNKMREEEENLDEVERAKASEKLTNRQKFDTNLIRWNGNSNLAKNIRVGDLIIQIQNGEKTKQVYPPFRVIHLKRYQTFDTSRKPRILIYVEEPKHFSLFEWVTFKNKLEKIGLKRISTNSCRRITSQETKVTILSLLSK